MDTTEDIEDSAEDTVVDIDGKEVLIPNHPQKPIQNHPQKPTQNHTEATVEDSLEDTVEGSVEDIVVMVVTVVTVAPEDSLAHMVDGNGPNIKINIVLDTYKHFS